MAGYKPLLSFENQQDINPDNLNALVDELRKLGNATLQRSSGVSPNEGIIPGDPIITDGPDVVRLSKTTGGAATTAGVGGAVPTTSDLELAKRYAILTGGNY